MIFNLFFIGFIFLIFIIFHFRFKIINLGNNILVHEFNKGDDSMRKILNVLTCLLLMFILMSHEQIYAYSFTGQKICTFYVDYRWGGSIISIHKNAFQHAINDWNRAQSKKSFRSGGPNAPGVLDSYSTDKEELGITTVVYNTETNCTIAWASKINKYYPETHYLTLARSTGNHELGHTLGLDHTLNPAIMNVYRDRQAIHLPQADDINGVNALY